MKPTILLVGAGAMGGSLLRGWIAKEAISAQSTIIDPGPSEEMRGLCGRAGLSLLPDASALHETQRASFQAVIFAVKPQRAAEVLPGFTHIVGTSVVISVIAGTSVNSLRRHLGGARKIIRTMPNLPASVGFGMTGLYANEHVSVDEQAMAERLMAAVGETVSVPTEDGIDVVTAISGSGPAYVFLMTEALAEAGQKLGLPAQTAATLARQTAIGAGRLLEADPRVAAALREAVTSPGGTTAAALSILDGTPGGLRSLLEEATANAARRASELSE